VQWSRQLPLKAGPPRTTDGDKVVEDMITARCLAKIGIDYRDLRKRRHVTRMLSMLATSSLSVTC
jgi:hypothetical protein